MIRHACQLSVLSLLALTSCGGSNDRTITEIEIEEGLRPRAGQPVDRELARPEVPSIAPPAPGHRLLVPLDARETLLVDSAGNTVHSWPSGLQAGHAAYIEDDGTLIRAVKSLRSPLPLTRVGGGAVQRTDFYGNVLWEFNYDVNGVLSHHDIEVLPNGNVLLIAWEVKTSAEAIQAGRNPALLDQNSFLPDHIIEVQQTGPAMGDIVWEWHAWDHLIQDFDPTKDNFGDVAAHPERIDVNYPPEIASFGDWNHCNSIDYCAAEDWIVLSARNQDEIWIIDHSTTTAEAATSSGGRRGKGGDLLWRWGNPIAYRAGTLLNRQLYRQHSTVLIPDGRPGAGNLMIFNNEYVGVAGSSVWEIELPRDANGNFFLEANGRYGPPGPVWDYSATGFDSFIVSSCERLPNGNTLICSGFQGWVFEVDPQKRVVWEHRPSQSRLMFQAHYVERTLWSQSPSFSRQLGGQVQFELRARPASAGMPYVVLGSMSGTAPGTTFGPAALPVPLNEDSYFMATVAGTAPILGAAGTIGIDGAAAFAFATPSLGTTLPLATVGSVFHHAVLTLDPADGAPVLTSNPVPFVITP